MWEQMTRTTIRRRKSCTISIIYVKKLKTNPEIEIILSGLTTREDNPQAGQTVIEVNIMLENYCEATIDN